MHIFHYICCAIFKTKQEGHDHVALDRLPESHNRMIIKQVLAFQRFLLRHFLINTGEGEEERRRLMLCEEKTFKVFPFRFYGNQSSAWNSLLLGNFNKESSENATYQISLI